MKAIEVRQSGRMSGSKIVRLSLAIGAIGVAPLALYIAFGPADGNPIGLGLLAVVAVPAAVLGLAFGLVKMAIERFTERSR